MIDLKKTEILTSQQTQLFWSVRGFARLVPNTERKKTSGRVSKFCDSWENHPYKKNTFVYDGMMVSHSQVQKAIWFLRAGKEKEKRQVNNSVTVWSGFVGSCPNCVVTNQNSEFIWIKTLGEVFFFGGAYMTHTLCFPLKL